MSPLNHYIRAENSTAVILSRANVKDLPFSHHKAVFFSFKAGGKLRSVKRTVVSRSIRKIDTVQPQSDVEPLVESDLADCPNSERPRQGQLRPPQPAGPSRSSHHQTCHQPALSALDDGRSEAAKRKFRRTERRWRKSLLSVHTQTSSVHAAKNNTTAGRRLTVRLQKKKILFCHQSAAWSVQDIPSP